jgi:hypothetical protein
VAAGHADRQVRFDGGPVHKADIGPPHVQRASPTRAIASVTTRTDRQRWGALTLKLETFDGRWQATSLQRLLAATHYRTGADRDLPVVEIPLQQRLATARHDRDQARAALTATERRLSELPARGAARRPAVPSGVVEEVTPVSVALHTLAHLLILELSFHSGYAATSLAERLYVGSPGEGVRAAILLYTAAGDTEGTMGGLVRLGRPGSLEPILIRALARAEWCSADPVCSELGTQVGQGPDGCNLASCYACSIVPETSCEDFNRFLDRELVIGDKLGLFGS